MKSARVPDFPLISRRRFLGLGAGALSLYGLASSAHSSPTASSFFEPEVRRSSSGFLVTTLRASTMPTVVRGQVALASVYEGTFPGPTLVVRPGDYVRIELINDLAEATNLHFHGLHVMPESPGDNVLLHIAPGERFTYQFVIPVDHPGGTYFYHPHLHGLVTNQVFKGMAGLLIIEGDIDQLPGVAGLTERSMVMMRTVINNNGVIPSLSPNGGVGQGSVLINGASTPTIVIRPGETQRWRLLNATVASIWDIQVANHPLTLIAQDGNTLANATTVNAISLATAQRRDVLIQGGQPGVYAITFQDRNGFGSQQPKPLATLEVTGPAENPQPLPTTLIPFLDLRALPVDRARILTFDILGPGGPTFAQQGFVIDGQPFDEHRIDQFVNLGDTEEWTILNPSFSPHPFHIHINPFQITAINGQPQDALSYEDTTTVGANGGSITFRTRFLDFPGTWVYHCHILGHEDGGMMGLIQANVRLSPGFRPSGPFLPEGPSRPTGPGRPVFRP